MHPEKLQYYAHVAIRFILQEILNTMESQFWLWSCLHFDILGLMEAEFS